MTAIKAYSTSAKFFAVHKWPAPKLYTAVILLLFISISAVVMLHHEMWRDELQAWLIARDSNSLSQLSANLKYEGHPGLWHLCLMTIKFLGGSVLSMQWFHLAVASFSFFLVVRYAPFTWLQKFLFAFGYYTFYEYAIISRNYAIGVLLIFALCVLHKNRNEKFIFISVLLLLLSQTNVYGLIFSIAYFFSLMIEVVFKKTAETKNNKKPLQLYAGLLLILIGILFSMYQIMPPPDQNMLSGWHFRFGKNQFFAFLLLYVKSFFPIAKFQYNFWNTTIWESGVTILLLGVLVASFIFYWIKIFYKKIFIQSLLVFFLVGISCFSNLSGYGADYRHNGYIYIVTIACIWMYLSSSETNLSLKFSSNNKIRSTSITALFLIQCIAGISAAFFEYKQAFSNAAPTAAYIKQKGLNSHMIVGYPDAECSPIVGLLNRPSIFYLQTQRTGSFVLWDAVYSKNANKTMDTVLLEAQTFCNTKKDTILFISNTSIKEPLPTQVTFLKSFEGSVVNENYFLYLLTPYEIPSGIIQDKK